MYKKLSIFILISIMIPLFLSACGRDQSKKIIEEKTALESKVTTLEKQIASKEEEVKKLTKTNMELVNKNAALTRRLNDIGGAVTQEEEDFNSCEDNLKRIALGLRLYAADHNNKFSKKLSDITPNPKYLDFIPTCPAVSRDTYSPGYTVSPDGKKYIVKCFGHNHAALRIKAGFPAFDSVSGLVVEREGAAEAKVDE